jgi:hypothetical protein
VASSHSPHHGGRRAAFGSGGGSSLGGEPGGQHGAWVADAARVRPGESRQGSRCPADRQGVVGGGGEPSALGGGQPPERAAEASRAKNSRFPPPPRRAARFPGGSLVARATRLCPGSRAQQIAPMLMAMGRARRGQPPARAWSHFWSRLSQCTEVDRWPPGAADHARRRTWTRPNADPCS